MPQLPDERHRILLPIDALAGTDKLRVAGGGAGCSSWHPSSRQLDAYCGGSAATAPTHVSNHKSGSIRRAIERMLTKRI